MSTLKSHFEDILDTELSAEPELLPVGLRLVFKKETDLISRYMKPFQSEDMISPIQYKNAAFCDLVDKYGVIHFVNATMAGTPNTKLSGRSLSEMGADEDGLGLQLQDIFHRDEHEEDNSEDIVTCIAKPRGIIRNVPTDYAHVTAVQEAIYSLNQDNLALDVRFAINAMIRPRHSFSLAADELQIRNKVMFGMPDFHGLVCDLIPDDKKFSHGWDSEEPEIIAHSNRPGNILHGRRRAENGYNQLIGMDISR